mmetsp:Transcript_35081/g.86008  ORF Transcript_35081/g.86008 Transcript_35081/m.86008 type:complete len:85 (+) Transcript_35081:1751-2005(+)
MTLLHELRAAGELAISTTAECCCCDGILAETGDLLLFSALLPHFFCFQDKIITRDNNMDTVLSVYITVALTRPRSVRGVYCLLL